MFWFQFYSDPRLWPPKSYLLGQDLAKNFLLGEAGVCVVKESVLAVVQSGGYT